MAKGLYAEKVCFKCKEKKITDLFFKHRQTSDGFHSWCKDCCNEGNKKSRAKLYSTFEGRIPTFLRSCKNGAYKRNQEFSLVAQDFRDMWEEQAGLCAYTGLPMELKANSLYSVSVERIDSSIGYTKVNTILVLWCINKMKTDLNGELFFKMCKSVTLWLADDNLDLDVEFKKYG
jgi:hypothetical protein